MGSSEETTIRDGITMRRLSECGTLSVDYVEVAPGSREFLVTHYECDDVWYVLEATVGDRTWTVRPGNCIEVPRDTPHGSHNAAGEPVGLQVVNSPPWTAEHDHEPA